MFELNMMQMKGIAGGATIELGGSGGSWGFDENGNWVFTSNSGESGILGGCSFSGSSADNSYLWPVPDHNSLNIADKPKEGDGAFGSPRNTSSGASTHTGIDIQAPVGSPVIAIASGTVSSAVPQTSSTYGNQVVIEHANGIYSQSAHLDTVTVKPGDYVNAGDQIGTVGRTGNTPSQGDSHLHFEIRKDSPQPRKAGGTVADPLDYLPKT